MEKLVAPPRFYRVSTKAFVVNAETKLLLIQEHDGRWELPGGGLDYNESMHDGLRREIQEELGVRVHSISKTPLYVWTQEREKEGKYYCLFLGYKVELESLTFQTSPECVAAQFFSVEEMQSLTLHPNATKVPMMFQRNGFKETTQS